MEPFTPDSVRQKLNAAKGQWPTICEATGLNYSWLTKFARNEIPNPGWNRVKALAEYFAAVPA